MITEANIRVGVFALQGDTREHATLLNRVGAQTVAVRSASDLVNIDGLVLPGGESTTMFKLAQAFGLFDPLCAYVQAGRPVYGSCAGMIMLASELLGSASGQQTLGAINMTVRRNAFGRQIDSAQTTLNPGAFGGKQALPAVFIRAPWVEEVGPQVEVLATVPAGKTEDERIVAVRQGNALATSFHPELSSDDRVHAYFLDMVKAHKNWG